VSAHVAARRETAVEIFENTEFRIGNLRTVEVGLAQVRSGGFLLMNIDHIYGPAVAERIRAMDGANVTAMVDFDRPLGADDMKVTLDGQRHVARISKQLDDFDCGYVGMTFVPAAKLERYRAAVAAARARHGDKAVAEQVLAQLAEEGEPVDIGDISGIGWHEVDTPEDSAKAEAALRRA
jgi:choline kinase